MAFNFSRPAMLPTPRRANEWSKLAQMILPCIASRSSMRRGGLGRTVRHATSLRLWVLTNGARGAGVEASATVHLQGTHGHVHLLLVPPDGEFRRGSRQLFKHWIDFDLGKIQNLEVGINKPGSWLLDRILVAVRNEPNPDNHQANFNNSGLSNNSLPSDKVQPSTSLPAALSASSAPSSTLLNADPFSTTITATQTPTITQFSACHQNPSSQQQVYYMVQATNQQPQALPPTLCHVEQRCVFEWGKRIGNDTDLVPPAAVQLRYREATLSDNFDYGSSVEPAVRTQSQQRRKEIPLAIKHTAIALPHPNKVSQGMKGVSRPDEGYAGEDAYAVHVSPRGTLFAIADGVRSWAIEGINSGDVATNLVLQARQFFSKAVDASLNPYVPKPLSLLSRVWTNVQLQGHKGSSTICLITLDLKAGVLRSATLGDSGYMVLRGMDSDAPYKVYSSPQQEHEFGWPFQLGHHENSDKPSDAILHEMRLLRGDIIVAGTDGLFDNLGEIPIVSMIQQSKQPWMMARELAFAAFEISIDSNAADLGRGYKLGL